MKKIIINAAAVLKEMPATVVLAAVMVFYITDRMTNAIADTMSVGHQFCISIYGNVVGILLIGIGLFIASVRVERKRKHNEHLKRVRLARRRSREFYSEVLGYVQK